MSVAAFTVWVSCFSIAQGFPMMHDSPVIGPSNTFWMFAFVSVFGLLFTWRWIPETRGRTLDHVGFEVKDLEAFCRRLVAAGITLERPYAMGADGVATALLTDPWGTSLELTEGLGHWSLR